MPLEKADQFFRAHTHSQSLSLALSRSVCLSFSLSLPLSQRRFSMQLERADLLFGAVYEALSC
jgi:hypothetical protein